MIGRRACLAMSLVGLAVGTSIGATSIGRAQSVQPAPSRLALKGYDPVAYFTDGKPIQGKPEYEAVYDEARYRFSISNCSRPTRTAMRRNMRVRVPPRLPRA